MSKYKYIPTWKLIEILDSPHCTGVNGKDYEPVKDELQQVLWERLSRYDHDQDINDYYNNDKAA
jgi:hypothetical protein